ncbi:MAG: hypothetical protein M3P26_11840 [Gemmatimonadota bacterium]|nr:hypothetical protein [Gemmatimonadota bacterium]
MVVVVGFFATVQSLIVQASNGTAPAAREAVTLALALGFAVRYWWVILLLQWPARWFRTLLLLLAWSALPVVAMMATNAVRWALALAALSAVGCMTEVYNGITRQWLVGSEAMARSLKTDHVSGAVSAGGAAVCLVLVAFFRPVWLDLLIPSMVFADWARLILMIRRHQRFIDLELLT